MENEEIYCALCGRIPECEEPAVLTMGRYGHPRHLCEECESQMDTANLGRDYDEIINAIDILGKKATSFAFDDDVTMDVMRAFIMRAAKRAADIKAGNYNFDVEDAPVEEEGFDEIPEELRETEEDAELDRRDAENAKKFDKFLNVLWIGVFTALFVFFMLKVVFRVI
ncbi:MAG: hypothetical protein IKA67_03395 [Clostridia bacterium]|nr:hypothetical protein [Clostridia bacterium]